MRIHPAPQGSQEWIDARLGIPTASQFHRIVTPAKLAPAKGATTYLHELLAEWLTGVPSSDAQSAFMDRGNAMEAQARGWYGFETDTEPVEVGLCLTDDGCIGASPDAMVGDDGLLEIKCPGAAKHIGYLLDGPGSDYRLQIQGQLWVTGRDWCDFLSFNPVIANKVVRVYRDDSVMAALDKHLPAFVARMMTARGILRGHGCVPPSERPAPEPATFDEVTEVVDGLFTT